MNMLPWIEQARSLIGVQEVPGAGNNAQIVQMFKDIRRGGIKDDSIPWCAAFVGACLERAGIPSSRFESAKSYLKWGVPLVSPVFGCVVVLIREGGGHVGFVVGRNEVGDLLVLGGNQSDAVNIKTFPIWRVSAYRWPVGYSVDTAPLAIGSADMSKTEA